MRDEFQLFLVVGRAALITIIACFAFLLLGFKIAVTHGEQEILGMVILLAPTGIAAWWMFRKLQVHYTRREARAVATVFGLSLPVSLGAGFLLAELTGGYAEALLGTPFALAGALAGVAVITTLVSFVPSVIALWMTRRVVKLESTHE